MSFLEVILKIYSMTRSPLLLVVLNLFGYTYLMGEKSLTKGSRFIRIINTTGREDASGYSKLFVCTIQMTLHYLQHTCLIFCITWKTSHALHLISYFLEIQYPYIHMPWFISFLHITHQLGEKCVFKAVLKSNCQLSEIF